MPRISKQSLVDVMELSTKGEVRGATLQVGRDFMFDAGTNVVECCDLHDVKRKRHHETMAVSYTHLTLPTILLV